MSAAEIVRAAGGAVVRPAPAGGLEVLLVHRPGHGDWTLPKGKAEPDETDEACALREVAEETGLRCVPGVELPSTAYRDRFGRPKAVRYWTMTVAGGRFTPNDEVDEVRWLPVPDALRLLTYDGDRAVLRSIGSSRQALLLLVRHGRARPRTGWAGDDRRRPLDDRGRRQAEGLVGLLAAYPVTRLLSSPSERCVQTLGPLATRLQLPIEPREELEEGASRERTFGFMVALAGTTAALSTHGDVIEAIRGEAEERETGSTWVLAVKDGTVEPVRYLPPSG